MPFEPGGRPSLVGRERLTCGDVMVTQTFSGELASVGAYMVSLYFRPAEQKARSEYYLEHESVYWRGSIDIAAGRSSASFVSYGKARGAFSCADAKLTRPIGAKLGPKACSKTR